MGDEGASRTFCYFRNFPSCISYKDKKKGVSATPVKEWVRVQHSPSLMFKWMYCFILSYNLIPTSHSQRNIASTIKYIFYILMRFENPPFVFVVAENTLSYPLALILVLNAVTLFSNSGSSGVGEGGSATSIRTSGGQSRFSRRRPRRCPPGPAPPDGRRRRGRRRRGRPARDLSHQIPRGTGPTRSP